MFSSNRRQVYLGQAGPSFFTGRAQGAQRENKTETQTQGQTEKKEKELQNLWGLGLEPLQPNFSHILWVKANHSPAKFK